MDRVVEGSVVGNSSAFCPGHFVTEEHPQSLRHKDEQALDLAALHALTMGYLGGTMLVMVTRVSSTHSGRPQAMDRVARALYALLQVAVVMRLYGALEPTGSAMWLRWAGAAWMGVALVWAIRHGRWLGLPRADGRPG